MDHHSIVDALAASLIREYLSRKGLKSTLEQMDQEYPRNDQSVSSRQALMKQLHLEKLMKKNKEEPDPLRTMLEVMTKYFMNRQSLNQGNQGSSSTDLNVKDSDSLGSLIDFSPQTDLPGDSLALKPMTRPGTAALSARREKFHNELVVDDNVEGESFKGDGKSSLISGSLLDDAPPYIVQKPSSRPLSAKQRAAGPIRNTDDEFSQKRRQYMRPKSSAMPRLQQEPTQKQVLSSDKRYGVTDDLEPKSSNVMQNGLGEDFGDYRARNSKAVAPPPVSFEALLLKGEERANLLQRIGLEKKESEQVKESYKVESSSMSREKEQIRRKSSSSGDSNTSSNTLKSNTSKSKPTDIELGDLDDLESDMRDIQLKPAIIIPPKPVKLTKIHSTPIDLKTAIALKNLVLGSPSQLFNEEWLLQAFSFCDLPDIKYGILQKKGGPCGVLAAVQACLLQEMLFGDERLTDVKYKNPTRSERSKFLAKALSRIFWRAGDQNRAVVALPSDTTHLLNSSKFKQDGVTEKLSLYTFTNFVELSGFLSQSVPQFETDGCPGAILVMYGAILSRKQYLVKSDFDSPETTLIASHGYCTQELVNLLLTGRAVANTFNDFIQLDSDGIGEPVILKGINARSEIGLLSLFEHYKSCQVGTYLKTPKNPIWVVCSESHFSVLFSPRKDLVNDWKAERRFDLIYYDGLARQQEEIRLTVSTLNPSYRAPGPEEDLVPPLENCIRTKWADAEIDWNGYEPIL